MISVLNITSLIIVMAAKKHTLINVELSQKLFSYQNQMVIFMIIIVQHINIYKCTVNGQTSGLTTKYNYLNQPHIHV